MHRFRWGVLGVANIAAKKVIPAIQRSASSQIVAIASRDAAKVERAARSLGIPRSYATYEAMLHDPDVDAVYIPLPNHLHVPWTIRAAEAGKHVLCEKPIACSAGEARTLLDVRDRTGVQIAEAFMVRTHPRWLAVRDLVRAGRIGDIRLFVGHFSYHNRDRTDIRSRVDWGGGVLLDIGCYPTTLSRWLFDEEPEAVVGIIERDPEFTVDRLVSALLRFPSGQTTFTCGGQLVPHQFVQVFGTRGRIDLEIPFNTPGDRPTRIFLDDGSDLAGAGIETIDVPAADQYETLVDRFVEAARGLGPLPVPLEDSVQNMAVLDALFRSAESGRWERPSDF